MPVNVVHDSTSSCSVAKGNATPQSCSCLSWPKPVVLLGLRVDFWAGVAFIRSVTEQGVLGNLVRFLLFRLIRGAGDSRGWFFSGWTNWRPCGPGFTGMESQDQFFIQESCIFEKTAAPDLVRTKLAGRLVSIHSQPGCVCLRSGHELCSFALGSY